MYPFSVMDTFNCEGTEEENDGEYTSDYDGTNKVDYDEELANRGEDDEGIIYSLIHNQ